LMAMHPLKEAVEVKGSTEFTRSELVGILSFKLRRLSVGEAKRLIEEWLRDGLLEEREGKLYVRVEAIEENEPKALLGEMIAHIAKALGWTELEVMEGIKALRERYGDLDERNQSAAGSRAEGLDEPLTLHRLWVYGVLGRSFKTTNCLEAGTALVEERCAKVDHWQTSSQRHRWLATALLHIEPRLRKVMGYRHLSTLRDALKRDLKIDTTTSKEKAP